MSDTVDVEKLAKLLAGAQRAGYISIALPQCSGPADIQEVCDGLPALLRECSALRQRVGVLEAKLVRWHDTESAFAKAEAAYATGDMDTEDVLCEGGKRQDAENELWREASNLAAARQAGEGRE